MPKNYVVPDKLRTNPLSVEPGGFTVTVVKKKYTIVYENIKNWKAYVSKVSKTDVVSILVDDLIVYQS